jgi:hypothetical protein
LCLSGRYSPNQRTNFPPAKKYEMSVAKMAMEAVKGRETSK